MIEINGKFGSIEGAVVPEIFAWGESFNFVPRF
jgi:hypothetical protein